MTPPKIAEYAKSLSEYGVDVKVLGEKEMKKLGMGSLLGVGQGSIHESQLVIMKWNGARNKKKKPIAFIGKGVSFDTGGVSLKPSNGMEEMKYDMGGSGVVIGLMKALALRKAKANVIGVVGLVENHIGSKAQRPSDVVKSYSGQTIEVLNTDAEGRLVLADAITFTEKKFKPKFMIDLATLTGAMIVSLGKVRAGLFCNNNNLTKKIEASGEKTGDKVWSMPLDTEYDKMINTEIADMKNIGGMGAGSITAACFLQRHVEKTPWAHLDIAGVTWLNSSTKTSPSGASGWGVKLLFELIRNFDYKK